MADKKDAYQQKMEAQIKEWDAKMDMIKAKIKKANADAKIKQQETISNMNKRWEAVQEEWEKVKQTNTEAASELKKGLNNALVELRTAFERAQQKLEN